ncbi:hypothetical protein RHGRI_031468 [Rhododendron griersonianum]|uniref:Uncharacterized protein n=1 Tax=Rhododendron griersonianum TaxID=479676 RepID=A0AAV6I8G7_9ERIC|nr:hypothetical protein RHGRI_031468 [Rhododendron griersonianum]
MANARIARFVTEVAPPKLVCVMRQRASKVLDTINEEERDISSNDSLSSTPKSSSSSSCSTPTSASSSNVNQSKGFVKEVKRSLAIFGH